MITNNGKRHCNDCGKRIETLHGILLLVSKDSEHYCLKCYRKHFAPIELEYLDTRMTEVFQTKILGIPTPQDVKNGGPLVESVPTIADRP